MAITWTKHHEMKEPDPGIIPLELLQLWKTRDKEKNISNSFVKFFLKNASPVLNVQPCVSEIYLKDCLALGGSPSENGNEHIAGSCKHA